jgi:phosphomannomutase/phosphoglucomutase
VLDCSNGATYKCAPLIFSELGAEVTTIHAEPDGMNINDNCGSQHTQDLRTKVKGLNADIGLAFDGDGDRVGILDDKQNILWADRQMMLYAADVLKRKPGALIIFDIKSTTNLAIVIKSLGGEPLMWKTGHSFIKAKMKETGAELAGEMSGHIFFKERWFGFDDGLYSAARMLEIVSQHDETTSEIFEKLPDSINTPELQVNFEEGEHYKFMEEFIARSSFENAETVTIDGIRVNYANGWGLVRPSNTTPCLVLRFEANDEDTLKEIQNTFREKMLAVDSSLSLPF